MTRSGRGPSRASGLEATSGARVDARELTLTGARGAGLFLHGESRILLRNSRVTNNGLSGIFVDSTERVEVRDSTIAENGEHGVVLLRAPAGRLARRRGLSCPPGDWFGGCGVEAGVGRE